MSRSRTSVDVTRARWQNAFATSVVRHLRTLGSDAGAVVPDQWWQCRLSMFFDNLVVDAKSRWVWRAAWVSGL
jgi:hypothetical protein